MLEDELLTCHLFCVYITFSMTSSNTANIASGIYYYDLEETNGATVTTLMGGKVTVIGDISNG